MADIYGSHFEYGGVSSRDYGLIIANVNTQRDVRLSGAKSGKTIFNKGAKKRYLVGDDYSSSPIVMDIEFVTTSARPLEHIEIRQIEKWLFNHQHYRRLYMDMSDDCVGDSFEYIDGKYHRNYINCRFVNPEKIEYNGGIVGFKATLESDSNMYWQDAILNTYTLENADTEASSVITVEVDTDLRDYTYPKVTITMGEVGGDVIISNNTDDSTRLTKFIGISAGASIIMKGELNYIEGQYYEKFVGRNFIRLLDGENNLTVMGNVASIEIEYSARRYM